MAAKGEVDFIHLFAMVSGLSLIIASGCVFNNYFDRDIDKSMHRTSQRALVIHSLSSRAALIFGTMVGIMGALLLGLLTNLLTLLIAIMGWVVYVGIYTPLKRRSVHSTVVGSVAGAVAPVVGYSAAAGRLDAGALLLFLILVFWQMPHFYAIAIYRLKDYRSAGLPVLPVSQGLLITKVQIIIYIIAFIIVASLLSLRGYTGALYLVVMTVLGLAWLRLALGGLKEQRQNGAWARKVFLFSLVVLVSFSLLISFDNTFGIINL